MLKLSEFRHNHHPSDVRMLAKYISTWKFGKMLFKKVYIFNRQLGDQ
jgi:hypothetical protein